MAFKVPFNERPLHVTSDAVRRFLSSFSIEVMPRTAARIPDFREILPADTRVYIAHVEGTSFDDMVATAKRLVSEGFAAMPHIPARMIADETELRHRVRRYHEEAGVDEALVLAGGPARLVGKLHSSMQLLDTGIFEEFRFKRLHVAGHPEGNRDIDKDGSTRLVDEALLWKQDYARQSSAEMAIVTQFVFDARPVIAWAERLALMNVTLPIHVGIAGPAKLQTLLKFAITCGIGASANILQKRARDMSKLFLPFQPDDLVKELAAHRAAHPDSQIQSAHFFPLGGIQASTDWIRRQI